MSNKLMTDCFKSIEKFNDVSGFLNGNVNSKLEYDMLLEELKEYLDASINNDEIEIRDALADILVVWYGTVLKHGLKDEIWNVLNKVCMSNDTKFCINEQEAIESVDEYKKQNIEAFYQFNNKYNVYVIKRIDNKTLKSKNFKKPENLV